MTNPEQAAFRHQPDRVNEQHQADATSQLQAEADKTRAAEAKSEHRKVNDSAEAKTESPAELLMGSLARIHELASRLPQHVLAEFVDNQRSFASSSDSRDTHANQVLLAAIDPRDPATRDRVLGAILSAQA